MKKRCKLLCLLLSTLLLVACAPDIPQNGTGKYSFTDSTGQTVTLAEKPTRVAVLLSSFAEIWQLAGGEATITVGESVERGICTEGVTLVDEGAGKSINTEVLIAAMPDLVILSADIPAQVEAAALCREAGIPVAEMRVECFSEYLTLLKICTDLTGRGDLYEQYGTAQQAQIDALIANKPLNGSKILFVRAGSSARSVKPKSSNDHFAAAMLKELGATNIADGTPLLADGLSPEYILTADPDHIYFTAMGDEDASCAFVEQMLQSPEWQALSAVKAGRYTFLPKENFHYKPNANWASAYAYLCGGAA